MFNNNSIAVFIIFVLLSSLITAQNIIEIKSAEIQYIGNSIAVYEHPDNLPITTIDTINFNEKITHTKILQLGASDSYFWLKFKVKNSSGATLQLSIDQATINFLKLYKKVANNQFESTELGEHLPFHRRGYKHPVYVFDLNLENGASATYYLQVKSNETNTLPIAVFKASSYKKTLRALNQ
jgi:hypothetical protein